jgi:hypothetical protein
MSEKTSEEYIVGNPSLEGWKNYIQALTLEKDWVLNSERSAYELTAAPSQEAADEAKKLIEYIYKRQDFFPTEALAYDNCILLKYPVTNIEVRGEWKISIYDILGIGIAHWEDEEERISFHRIHEIIISRMMNGAK